MIKNKIPILLFFIIAITSNNIIAQKLEQKDYVVISIEDSFSKGFEGLYRYFWIIEIDSIKSTNNSFYPLLLSGFSKANFENCCNGVDVDPFALTQADSVFNIGTEYFKESNT